MPDGPEIEASAAPSGKKVAVDSHAKTTVVVKKIPVNILEMEDVLFHHNSAVLMPETPETESGKKDADASAKQKKVSGVKAMALLFQFLEVNPGKRLIVAGHTDSSGGVKINFELSALRAQGVMCLVDGDRDGWAKIAFGRHKVEDYQQILRYVFQNRKWPCNPGKIDDSWGPNTKSATAAFINYYNTEFADKFKGAYTDVFDLPRLSTGETALVDRDGKHRWTEALWKAAYAIYDKTIADALKLTPKALKDRRVELIKYVDDMNRFVACGESFPIDQAQKDNYRSKSNRRVEIIAIDEKEVVKIQCPRKKDGSLDWSAKHTEEQCPIWHKLVLSPAYIDPSDLHAVLYHMKFRYYNVMKKSFADVPEGIEIEAYENDAVKLETVTYSSGGVYSVKVRFKTALDDGSHDKLRFEFKAKDRWIYTKDTGSTPKIVAMDPSKPKEKVAAFALAERLKYYDLPHHWSSKNYWVCWDGNLNAGERYDEKKLRPTTGGKTTRSDKPMIFTLDDIVLVDKDGRQNVNDAGNAAPKDRDGADALVALSDKSRYSMLYVKDEALILHDPESADAPYFTNDPFTKNLITKLPADGQVRLIAFANDFYDVFDRRTTANDKFKADDHVLGARAAVVNDASVHVWDRFNHTDGVPAGHNNLFFAKSTGNFELHYLHDCCLLAKPADNGGCKTRSFLVVYWNGVFKPKQFNHATDPKKYENIVITNAHAETYATLGLKNARERWESKGYVIEPVNPPQKDADCAVQVKPFFFFEAKKNDRGGKPKCTVTISNDTKAGSMGITSSSMYHPDYKIRDYLGVGKYKDIDGKEYETLTVAHELGHAEGKDDEYSYEEGGIGATYQNPADDVFSQYYPGMPYQIDKASMMTTNRAPRAKHLWGFTNWINTSSEDNAKLKPFLKGSQFKIVNRFKSPGFPKTLEFKYHLGFKKSTPAAKGDYDFRNFIKPVKSDVKSTGTINTTLALYKMGEDEFAYDIRIGGVPMAFPFDAILPVSIKISLSFTKPATEARTWEDDVPFPGKPGYIYKRKYDWSGGLRKMIENLNGRFYLRNANAGHPFKNTYIFFFPIIIEGAPTAASDLDIEVYLDDSATIHTKSGKTLKVSNDVNKQWIVKYMLGHDDGAVKAFFKKLFSVKEKSIREHLEYIETWHEGVLDDLDLDHDCTLMGN
jgi:hypothetical protein